jgi:hypothetical protein
MNQKQRNQEIAKMLGYELITPEMRTRYQSSGGSPLINSYWQKDYPEKQDVLCAENYLDFHANWNWLMKAVGFIKENIKTSNNTQEAKDGEYFIDEWEFKINRYYIRLIQWTDKGWNMFNDKNRHLSILYIIGENCDSEIDAVFKAISDISKLYNEINK